MMVIKVKSKKRYILFILFFFLLIFATYYFILKDYSLEALKFSLQNCHVSTLLWGVILMFFYAFWGAFFLKRMLFHFGKKTTLLASLGYVCTENYFSAITPSSMGGQPVEMYEMNKDNIPYRINSIIILLNTILYKIALILLAFILFPFYFHSLFSINKVFTILVILGLVTTILVIFLFLLMVYSYKIFPKFMLRLIHLGSKLHLVKDEKKKKEEFQKALKDYKACAELTKKKPLILLEGLFYMILQRLSLLGVSYIIYLAFGLHDYSIFYLITVQIGITLASDFVPFPGGVVVSENLLLAVNETVYGPLLATSAMILLRTLSFYLFIIFCAIVYLIFHSIKRKRVVDL